MIEVLGLRGCGRRQVPTCACRINLQLHSRPLSPALASTSSSPTSLIPFYFSPATLSSFHRYTPSLDSFPSSSRVRFPFPTLVTLDSDYYISFFCFSYLPLRFALISYFSHKHWISPSLPRSHSRSSLSPPLMSILIEIAP